MSKALAGGLVIGGGLAAVFGKQAIDAASNLNETLSKTKVVLGSSAAEVIKWSETTAKSLGQSQQSALDAAATFGVFGKSAGLQGKALGDFSTKFTSLASDMASFSNTSPQEAIEAIGAALRGESEPIRRYGVLLDDATLRNQALKLGLIKTTKEALTPQNKVLAAQAEIFRQTKDAQGDFARTSDGVANKQRILAAQVENLKAKLGKGLLPVFSGFLTVANSVVLPAVDKIQVGFKALGAAFSGEGITSSGFVGAMEHIGVAFRAARLGVSALFKSFKDGDVTSDGFVGGMERIGVALRTIAAEAGPRIKAAISAVLPALRSAGAAVGTFVTQNVIPFVTAVATKIGPVLVQIGQRLGEFFGKVVLPTIRELVPVLGSFVNFVTSKVVPIVARVGKVFAGFVGFLSSHAGAVKTFAKVALGLLVARFVALKVKAAIDGVRLFVANVAAGVRSTITFAKNVGNAVSSVASFGKNALVAAANVAKQTAAFVAQKVAMLAAAVAQKALTAAQVLLNIAMTANPVGLIVAAIAALAAGIFIAYKKFKPFRDVVDAVGRAFRALAQIISSVVVGAFNWIKDHWPLLLGILTGPFGLVILIVTKNFSKIKAIVSGVFDFIKTKWPLLLAVLTGPIGLAVLAISRHWETIKHGFALVRNFIGDKIHQIVSFFTGLPGKIAKEAKGAFDGLKEAFKSAINFIIKGWNGLDFTLPSVKVFGKKIGGFTLGTPDIPELAKGGVINAPLLALLGETPRARPEIVAPARLLRTIFRDELKDFAVDRRQAIRALPPLRLATPKFPSLQIEPTRLPLDLVGSGLRAVGEQVAGGFVGGVRRRLSEVLADVASKTLNVPTVKASQFKKPPVPTPGPTLKDLKAGLEFGAAVHELGGIVVAGLALAAQNAAAKRPTWAQALTAQMEKLGLKQPKTLDTKHDEFTQALKIQMEKLGLRKPPTPETEHAKFVNALSGRMKQLNLPAAQATRPADRQPVIVNQHNTIKSDRPTLPELSYIGQQTAWQVRNTGRRP